MIAKVTAKEAGKQAGIKLEVVAPGRSLLGGILLGACMEGGGAVKSSLLEDQGARRSGGFDFGR
ncbi:hypothetical protein [Peribacillus deserti]|uniref:Uncharacterized protein n=1 Tax=Peribacillus deserti TaxID=673318 RepID=A0A2N5M419_9BACI|nr:hypothetical protein [Peribacillus deserti]PLT29111.1 hypothetical protein CUU66_14950 [Peribacillus deserti]